MAATASNIKGMDSNGAFYELPPQRPEQLAEALNVTLSNLKYRFYELQKAEKITGSFSVKDPLSIEQQTALINYFLKPDSQPVSQSVSQPVSQLVSQSELEIERQRANQLASQLELVSQSASQTTSQLEIERQRADQLASQLELVSQSMSQSASELEKVSQLVSQLELERQRANQSASELETTKRQLAAASQSVSQLAEVKRELTEAKQTIKQLESVKTELATTKVKYDSASQSASELEKFRALASQLESQLAVKTRELELASHSVSQLAATRKQLELANQSVSQLEIVQQQLNEATTNNNFKEVLRLKSELGQIETERDGKQQQIEALHDEVELWREQVENYRQQVSEARRMVFNRDVEIQKKISELNAKELDTIQRVEAKETEMLGLIQGKIEAAKIEWDNTNNALIEQHLATIGDQQATIDQYKQDVIEVIKDKKIDKWETWEAWGITIISGLAYLLFMIYQGVNSYDYFLMENTEGVKKEWYSAGAFAIGFSTLGFILTMVLPMANKKLAEAYLWDLIPVRILPLTAFTAACIYMNFYYNTKGKIEDSFFSNIGFQSALPPLCEYAFGFVILVLVDKRKEIIELLKLITRK